MKKILIIAVLITAAGCAQVNVRVDDKPAATRPPDFQKRYNYWWWGLQGRHSVNVREICASKPAVQMQTVSTIANVFTEFFTLGIYAPRTARVWCGEGNR